MQSTSEYRQSTSYVLKNRLFCDTYCCIRNNLKGIVGGMDKKFVITVGILLIITGITGIYMVINNVSGSWGRIVTGLMIVLAIVNVRNMYHLQKK